MAGPAHSAATHHGNGIVDPDLNLNSSDAYLHGAGDGNANGSGNGNGSGVSADMDDGDNRTRNAKAQRRHREKRKAHLKALEESVQVLTAQLEDARRQLGAAAYGGQRLGGPMSPQSKDYAQLQAENVYLREENADLRRQLYAYRVNYGHMAPPPGEPGPSGSGKEWDVKPDGFNPYSQSAMNSPRGDGGHPHAHPHGHGGPPGVGGPPGPGGNGGNGGNGNGGGGGGGGPPGPPRGGYGDPASSSVSSSIPLSASAGAGEGSSSVSSSSPYPPPPPPHPHLGHATPLSRGPRSRVMSSSSAPSLSPYISPSTSFPAAADARSHPYPQHQHSPIDRYPAQIPNPNAARYETRTYSPQFAHANPPSAPLAPLPPPHTLPRSGFGYGHVEMYARPDGEGWNPEAGPPPFQGSAYPQVYSQEGQGGEWRQD